MNIRKKLRKISTITIGVGIALTGSLVLLRSLGWLQPLEWAGYDWFFQLRPLEPMEPRIIIVGLGEKEIHQYYPLSDRTLAELIEKIKVQQPIVIGLDFYRDFSVGEGKEALIKTFKETPQLIAVEKVIGDEDTRVKPPSLLKQRGQIAASDVVVDSDGVVRRGLLVPIADGKSNLYTLGATVALLYLQSQKISFSSPDGKNIQLGQQVFRAFSENDGGYRGADQGGYQVLINFRNPQQSFQRVSFSDVLSGKIEANLFRERIVLVGTTAESIKDEFYTPFSRSLNRMPQTTYGVEVQANVASHLLSAVLERRPTIQVMPKVLENLFIVFWGILSGLLIWRLRQEKNYVSLSGKIFLISLLLTMVLGFSSYQAFLRGWWLPLVPSLLEIGGITILMSGGILHQKNQDLKNLYQQLEKAQEQMILEEKQKALANLVAGVAHEVNNPLNFIINFADLNLEWGEKLQQELEKNSENLSVKSLAEIEKILELIRENLQEILEQGQRATRITQSLLLQASSSSQARLTDINELVDSMLSLVTYSFHAEKQDFCLTVETDYEPAIGERMIVAEDLQQILINLIKNAFHAVFEAQTKLGEHFDPMIQVTTQLRGEDEIEIAIIDNGEGIRGEIQDQIFEPFKSTKPPHEGTGLGLYITYELVRKNGGNIRWLRDKNCTYFVVNFPQLSS